MGEQVGGINIIHLTKLTAEHFDKNSHSRMRVHLSVQVLSLSMLEMLKSYYQDNVDSTYEHASFMVIIKRLNTVVDIWNHPMSKTFQCVPIGDRYEAINEFDHEYIKYLEEVLVMLTDWYENTKVAKKPYEFIPKMLYDSFTLLVYGLKEVAI